MTLLDLSPGQQPPITLSDIRKPCARTSDMTCRDKKRRGSTALDQSRNRLFVKVREPVVESQNSGAKGWCFLCCTVRRQITHGHRGVPFVS
jgi:hypothetical protein